MLNLSSMEIEGEEFVTSTDSLSEDFITIEDYAYAIAKNSAIILDEVSKKNIYRGIINY